MAENVQSSKLSTGKRVAGLACIAAAVSLGLAIGFWVTGFFGWEAPPPERAIGSPLLLAFVLLLLGGLAIGAGLAGYFLILLTHCFTFDFSRPIFAAFKTKLYVANIVVPLFLIGGGALCVAAILAPTLKGAGLAENVAILVPAIGTFLLLQFFLIWLNIWAPLDEKLAARRLAAGGISPEQLESGVCIGISDPAKSSFKKMTLVVEDCGKFWFTPEALRYRGDTDQFDIARDQLIEIERKVDAGSIAAYAGAVHVILRFKEEDGCERRVRLHPGGAWTLTAAGKAMDRLAEQIAAWKEDAAVPAANQTPFA